MNKPSKFALALAFATATATVCGTTSAEEINNWQNPYGTVWKNGTNGLRWHNAFLTPAADGPNYDSLPTAQVTPPPARVEAQTATKVTFNADTFFDFDKDTLKAEGEQVLDQVVKQAQATDLETIIAIGHTDSIGRATYNQELSELRATSVKLYLVGRGIDANLVHAEGKGKTQPVATNATESGRAQNRRVEIKIIGLRR